MKEKRRYVRVQLSFDVRCEAKDGSVASGRVLDISVGGVYIETPDAMPFGTELTITGKPSGSGAALSLPGTVRWNKQDGFGVQFGLLGAKETHAITELVRKAHRSSS